MVGRPAVADGAARVLVRREPPADISLRAGGI
jgi:hypothetical protein